MRFKHDGISLWYGTADAPAPQETIFAETDISLTVGIEPLDASNRLEVYYRVNQGSTATLTAKPLQSDPLRRLQYFRAYFPTFRAGDRVEYAVICRCAGRQVPAQIEAEHWVSFQIMNSAPQSISGNTPERELPQTSDITSDIDVIAPLSASLESQEAILSDVFKSPLSNPNQEQGVVHQAIAQLLDQDTGFPLKEFTVRAWDLKAQKDALELGSDITNGHGLFALSYTTSPKEQIQSRRLRLDILDSQGQQIYQTEIRIQPDSEQVVEVRIPVPAISEPPSPTLTQLASIWRSQFSPQFLSTLANQEIRTLADAKKVGDIRQIKGLQDSANNPAISILEAYVNLSSLSDDDQLIPRLIEKKLTSIADIAKTTRVDFVSKMREQVGDFSAAQLQVKARAQTQFLNNALIGLQADSANGFSPPISIPNLLPDEDCSCRNCEAAVSPAAYLADLLDYALNHLKNNNSLIELQFLTDTFHQPFGELPTSCSSAEKQLRQVRICIEVLRHYLNANPPSTTQQPVLELAEKQ